MVTGVLKAVWPELSVTLAVSVWAASVKDVVFRLKFQLLVPDAFEKVPPSTETWTKEIAPLPEAVPETVTIPDTAAPFAGAVIDTTGGATALLTVTVSPTLVVLVPAVSFATAFSVCVPFRILRRIPRVAVGCRRNCAPHICPVQLELHTRYSKATRRTCSHRKFLILSPRSPAR